MSEEAQPQALDVRVQKRLFGLVPLGAPLRIQSGVSYRLPENSYGQVRMVPELGIDGGNPVVRTHAERLDWDPSGYTSFVWQRIEDMPGLPATDITEPLEEG